MTNIINVKEENTLKVARKYTYQVFTNGNNEKTIAVQFTTAFKGGTTNWVALVTMSFEEYENIDVATINRIFENLKKHISEYGTSLFWNGVKITDEEPAQEITTESETEEQETITQREELETKGISVDNSSYKNKHNTIVDYEKKTKNGFGYDPRGRRICLFQ